MTNDQKVLILDDEEILRNSLREFLEDEWLDVVSAATGEEALGLVKKHPVDVCIVDMRLPRMDGNSFILKAFEANPGLKFIIHTGSSDYTLPRELISIGIENEYVLRKPVDDPMLFIEKIKALRGVK